LQNTGITPEQVLLESFYYKLSPVPNAMREVVRSSIGFPYEIGFFNYMLHIDTNALSIKMSDPKMPLYFILKIPCILCTPLKKLDALIYDSFVLRHNLPHIELVDHSVRDRQVDSVRKLTSD
jgi:hypothetical protein